MLGNLGEMNVNNKGTKALFDWIEWNYGKGVSEKWREKEEFSSV